MSGALTVWFQGGAREAVYISVLTPDSQSWTMQGVIYRQQAAVYPFAIFYNHYFLFLNTAYSLYPIVSSIAMGVCSSPKTNVVDLLKIVFKLLKYNYIYISLFNFKFKFYLFIYFVLSTFVFPQLAFILIMSHNRL